jgi:hypothetical protein
METSGLKSKPIVNEVFADNGEHSHYELLDADTGEVLWTEVIEVHETVHSKPIMNSNYEHAKEDFRLFMGLSGGTIKQ